MELPYNPAIALLGIYKKKLEKLIWKNIFTPVFIAALFTIAKIWKQQVSISRWVDKTAVVHLHNGILLDCKKKKILPFVITWMDLENIMLSEISQSDKQITYDFTDVWNLMNKIS